MKTVVLYRTISWSEVASLLQNGKVEGNFSTAHKDNGYKPEYGNVVCCFNSPIIYTKNGGEVMVEITTTEDRIVGNGVGFYETYDPYDRFYESSKVPETFLSYYTLEEVQFFAVGFSKTQTRDSFKYKVRDVHFYLDRGYSVEEIAELATEREGLKKQLDLFVVVNNNEQLLNSQIHPNAALDVFTQKFSEVEYVSKYDAVPDFVTN